MLPAGAVAQLLAEIVGPSGYDRAAGGAPLRRESWRQDAPTRAPRPDPGSTSAHTLPRGVVYAAALADALAAYIRQLDLAGEPGNTTRAGADFLTEITHRLPDWPDPAPLVAPPAPPAWLSPVMTPPELLIFGSRLLNAASRLSTPALAAAQLALAARALRRSVQPD